MDATAADRALFRDPEAVIVLVAPRDARSTIFTPAGLAYVQDLTETLRAVPGVRRESATSLSTVLDVTTSARHIRLTRFLDPAPSTEAAAAAVRRRLDEQGLLEGSLYGRDGRSAAVYLPIDAAASRTEVVRRLREAMRRAPRTGFEARLTGPMVAEVMLGEQILDDLRRLVPIVMLVVAAALLLGLRSAAGASIPMLEMVFVLTWTFGTMAMFGVPLTIVTSILPVLLMAMAITDQIHVLDRVQAYLGRGESRDSALRRTYAEIGLPIVRTALTTAIGFLAFTTATVPAMRHFGLFACLGLLFSMAFSFTLIPALLAVIPERWLRKTRPQESEPRGFEGWAARHPRAALIAAVALFVALITGLPRLRVQDSWVQNFHPRSDLVMAERRFDREYGGSYQLDLTLESREDAFFRSVPGLRLLDSLEQRLARDPDVGATHSLPDVVRAGLRGVEPDRRIETLDDSGLAQLLVLLEMTGSQSLLDRLVTPSGDAARVRCSIRGASYEKATPLLARADSIARDLERHAPVRARVTGTLPVATQVVRSIVSNQARSIAATLLGLLVLLSISFRSITIAAVLLLPVLATTLMVLGGMGWAAIPLGVATSMFASLAEGEGVNYTIHLVTCYLRLRKERTASDALRQTLETVGPAVRWNGVALVAGCLVLCFSALQPVRALGMLLAAGMTSSYILAFLLMPAILPRVGGGPREERHAP